MHHRTFSLNGHEYSIEVVETMEEYKAVVKRDGDVIKNARFKPDQDIRITVLDILESDIRNGLIK